MYDAQMWLLMSSERLQTSCKKHDLVGSQLRGTSTDRLLTERCAHLPMCLACHISYITLRVFLEAPEVHLAGHMCVMALGP